MTDERIIAYLLKELPEEELERFEDECFASENWPAQVGMVEEELIDDYLSDALAPEQRRSFESNYLTTSARVERVRFAAALMRHADTPASAEEVTDAPPPPAKPTWRERLRAWWGGWVPRAAVAFAALVLAVGAWWLVRAPAPTTFATLTLNVSNADRAQGAPAPALKLPRDTDAVRISLTLPDPPSPAATQYRAQLEDDGGAVKFSENVKLSESAPAEGRAVSVTIPASKLPRGQYAFKLFAVRADGSEQRLPGSYLFNVE